MVGQGATAPVKNGSGTFPDAQRAAPFPDSELKTLRKNIMAQFAFFADGFRSVFKNQIPNLEVRTQISQKSQ
jgi:hypothetical protein